MVYIFFKGIATVWLTAPASVQAKDETGGEGPQESYIDLRGRGAEGERVCRLVLCLSIGYRRILVAPVNRVSILLGLSGTITVILPPKALLSAPQLGCKAAECPATWLQGMHILRVGLGLSTPVYYY